RALTLTSAPRPGRVGPLLGEEAASDRRRGGDMEQLLPGKVALITGAGSGQGRAAAVLFARHGARIGVIDVNPEGAEETVRLVKDAGGEARAVVADVSVRADADR